MARKMQEIREELDLVGTSMCANISTWIEGHSGHFQTCQHPICRRFRRAINDLIPSEPPFYPEDDRDRATIIPIRRGN